MATAKRTLFFEDEILHDLVYLARHAEKLPEIAARASEAQTGAMFSQIEKHVSCAVGVSEVDVERILRILQNIYRLQIRMRRCETICG